MTVGQVMSKIATEVLVPALIALLTVLAGLMVDLIRTWAASIKARAMNETISRIIGQVTDAASAVVAALQQEVVDDLKAKSADGCLTAEEIADIRDMAMKRLKAILGQETTQALEAIVPDVEAYLRAKIEEQVVQLKSVLQ